MCDGEAVGSAVRLLRVRAAEMLTLVRLLESLQVTLVFSGQYWNEF